MKSVVKRIQLDSVQRLLLVQQVGSVLGKQSIDLFDVMLLGQFNGLVPLVKMYTAVNGFFHFPCLKAQCIGKYVRNEKSAYRAPSSPSVVHPKPK